MRDIDSTLREVEVLLRDLSVGLEEAAMAERVDEALAALDYHFPFINYKRYVELHSAEDEVWIKSVDQKSGELYPRVYRTDEGVVVDVWGNPANNDAEPVATTWAFHADGALDEDS